MIGKDRKLVVFSILTSLFSGLFGFVNRFVESLEEIDAEIVFITGILLLVIVIILLFFLVKNLIGNISLWRINRKKVIKKKKRRKKK
ncbi:MAG: hypothetical protein ABH811_00245 [archaeon]